MSSFASHEGLFLGIPLIRTKHVSFRCRIKLNSLLATPQLLSPVILHIHNEFPNDSKHIIQQKYS